MGLQRSRTPLLTGYWLQTIGRFRYGFAAATVVCAWGVTSLVSLGAPQRPLTLTFFVAAVALSAGLGGVGPGIFATILAALTFSFFFLTPLHSVFVSREDLPLMILFLLVALLINVLSERLRAETRELAVIRDELLALNGILAAMNASLDMKAVTTTLRRQLTEHLGMPGGLLFLPGNEGGSLCLESGWGMPEGTPERMAGPLEAAFAAPSPLREQNVPGEALSLSDCALFQSDPELARLRWEAYLAVPLIANGEPQGLLCLFSDSAQSFQKGDPAFYGTLGAEVGVILQNARLYGEVRAGRENLQNLSRRLVQVQEAERRQIARELHDEIGQTLTGLKLSLEMSVRLPAEAAMENLRESLVLINELMAQVRDLSLGLRPAMLDDLGLYPTLLWHFARYTSATGVQVRFERTEPELRFPYEVETTGYRIVQEALTNVARYARTDAATVRLAASPELLVLQIRDDGCGFDADADRKEWNTGGLAGMAERVALLGGNLTVESSPGQGTCLTAELPLVPAVEESELP